nr:MAG TPA: hypothetical protein [Herelleviridae sp.]
MGCFVMECSILFKLFAILFGENLNNIYICTTKLKSNLNNRRITLL